MKRKIFLTDGATGDIVEKWKYIALNDSITAADKVKDGLQKTIQGLDSLPERGHIPPELERIGISEYHEIHFKPYRIIYFLKNNNIYVIAVFDGRRDIQEILARRCFRVDDI